MNINEKIIDQICPLLQSSFNAGGTLVVQGSLIQKEDTFVSRTLLNNTQLIASGIGKVTPIPWRRAKVYANTNGDRMNRNYNESLRFKARRNNYFCGVQWSRDFNGKEFTLKFQYKV